MHDGWDATWGLGEEDGSWDSGPDSIFMHGLPSSPPVPVTLPFPFGLPVSPPVPVLHVPFAHVAGIPKPKQVAAIPKPTQKLGAERVQAPRVHQSGSAKRKIRKNELKSEPLNLNAVIPPGVVLQQLHAPGTPTQKAPGVALALAKYAAAPMLFGSSLSIMCYVCKLFVYDSSM
jgi:hypothetical protein